MADSVLPGLEQLLKVQTCDSAIDRLTYSRSHQPAHSRLAEVKLEATVLRDAIDEAMAQRDTAAAQQRSLEDEVAGIEKRIREINDRLYGTTPVGPKDAQAMSEEVKHLEARRNTLEDQELEIMEVLEPVELELQQRQGEAEVLAQRARVAMGDIATAEAEIDAQLEAERERRGALVAAVPPSLVEHYEALRPKSAGIAVAKLTGSSCGGCHLTLSAQEVNKVRHSIDAVSHCEECGRMLVP